MNCGNPRATAIYLYEVSTCCESVMLVMTLTVKCYTRSFTKWEEIYLHQASIGETLSEELVYYVHEELSPIRCTYIAYRITYLHDYLLLSLTRSKYHCLFFSIYDEATESRQIFFFHSPSQTPCFPPFPCSLSLSLSPSITLTILLCCMLQDSYSLMKSQLACISSYGHR